MSTPAMAERARLVRDSGVEAVRLLMARAATNPSFQIQASAGVGSNARVPWIRIYSPQESPAPTEGWYVVYLFAADGHAVYLSLNQGTTNPGFGRKPSRELEERVLWALGTLSNAKVNFQSVAMNLADRGLGAGYERGNVLARKYVADEIPDDAELASDLAQMLGMLELLYQAESAEQATREQVVRLGGERPPLDDIPAFIDWMRGRYGTELVPSRETAEAEARRLLDDTAGRMTRDQALELGTLLNQGTWAGVPLRNRFSPAFAGHAMNVLVSDLDRFNEWTERLWRVDDADLAPAVDGLLRNPHLLPGAGRSYPTALLYLRRPDRYAVWLQLTHQGLAALTAFEEPRGRSGGWVRYERYCVVAHQFANAYDLAPQEVDAVLAEAGRAVRNSRVADEVAARLPLTDERSTDVDQTYETLSLGDLATRTHLPVDVLDEWITLLRGRTRQALLAGPPGTGKTYVATQLAVHLAGSSKRVAMAQFHPSFAYEDFIEGLRPASEAGEGLTYTVRDGAFKDFCVDAAKLPEETFVYLIDEINRADVGSVLGELMLLLEYRGRPVRLPYSHKMFAVPQNVVVLATMNTADRSLMQLDFALRRRFHTITLPPSRHVLAAFLDDADDARPALALFDLVQSRVRDPRIAPGHSYWMRDDVTAPALEQMWRYELRPYLAELWFDAPAELAQLEAEVAALLGAEA